MPDADLIALDIGGANLKAADGLGWTDARPFALWREWRRRCRGRSGRRRAWFAGGGGRRIERKTEAAAGCGPHGP
ncbi:hypothetical protein EBR56_09680, partial [bacterium]|nr:hypothetical protein [bacterium]